ncbi:MAG: SOS response-associated peptidase family protein [Bacillota bacterium]|nr:SOS response-associated peptidase family protein [Bacillota bacterium]
MRYQDRVDFLLEEMEVKPTQETLVISYASKIHFSKLRFGLQKQSLVINARLETIQEKPTFRHLERCIVPVSSFFEKDFSGIEHEFYQKEKIMFLAGLKNEEEFVIVTTKPNDSMSRLHDRMPFILPKKLADAWLLGKDITSYIPEEVNQKNQLEQLSLFYTDEF